MAQTLVDSGGGSGSNKPKPIKISDREYSVDEVHNSAVTRKHGIQSKGSVNLSPEVLEENGYKAAKVRHPGVILPGYYTNQRLAPNGQTHYSTDYEYVTKLSNGKTGYKYTKDRSDNNAAYQYLLGRRAGIGSFPLEWGSFDPSYKIKIETENPSARHYIFMLRPDCNIFQDTFASTNTNASYSPNATLLTAGTNSNDANAKDGHPTNVYVGYIGASENQIFRYLQLTAPEILASLTGYFTGGFAATGQGGGGNAQEGASAGQISGFGNAAYSNGTSVPLLRPNGGSAQVTSPITLPYHMFIPVLTNRIESLQLPDYAIKSGAFVQPYTKYSQPYSQSALESTTGGSFDITFREDRNYSIHKLFYAWIYYEHAVMRAMMYPKDKYIRYNSIDYVTDVYDFLVDETGENILYWAKYTGCIPTSVPMSDLSFNRGSAAESKVSIPFSYFYVEHMNIEALLDFNYNSLSATIMNTYCRPQNSWDGESAAKPADTRLSPIPYEYTVGPSPSALDASWDLDCDLFGRMLDRPIIYIDGRTRNIKLRWIKR